RDALRAPGGRRRHGPSHSPPPVTRQPRRQFEIPSLMRACLQPRAKRSRVILHFSRGPVARIRDHFLCDVRASHGYRDLCEFSHFPQEERACCRNAGARRPIDWVEAGYLSVVPQDSNRPRTSMRNQPRSFSKHKAARTRPVFPLSVILPSQMSIVQERRIFFCLEDIAKQLPHLLLFLRRCAPKDQINSRGKPLV